MKTSNKILLVAAILPVLGICFLIFFMRSAFEDSVYLNASLPDSQASVTRTFDIKDFSEISVDGFWDIQLIRGEGYYIEIHAPENILDTARVEKLGKKLFLTDLSIRRRPDGTSPLKVTIVLPSVSFIQLAGETSLDFRGIETDTLSIELRGVTRVTASDSSINNLKLTGTGTSTVDLSGTPIVNAQVEHDGIFSVVLLMNGGTLSGELGGVGTVTYVGNVSATGVNINNALSRVIH